MGLVEGMWRGRPHRALWGFVRGRSHGVEARWFWSRFLDAATVVATRWTPWPPARCPVLGRPASAWLLVLVWAAVPAWLLLSVLRHLGAVIGP